MGSWLRRAIYLLRHSRHEADLREELDAHRSLRAAQLEREGLTLEEAADASRRAIGNTLLAREDARDVWLGAWGTWWQDVRYGLRSFRRNLTFTAAAVVTIALGIGLNAGIVSVLNGVLFRDLPAPAAHELVSIQQTIEGVVSPSVAAGTFSAAEYRAYRDRTQTLSGVLAHSNPAAAIEAAQLRQRLRDAVEALPGVEVVAHASDPPLGEERTTIPIRLPGEHEDQRREAERNAVAPGYFSLLGIPIVRGRTFTEAEVANAARSDGLHPVVISETTARNLWPGGDPVGRTLLGQTLTLQDGTLVWNDITLEVIGVAADAQVSSLGVVDAYYVYLPYTPDVAAKLLVRSRLDVVAAASSIRAAAEAIDPALAVRVLPLEANLGWLRGVSAIVTTLGGGLGVLALVLATVGVYGVASYTVTGRAREIGIRMALGATRRTVLGMILRQTMRPVVIGAAIGVAAASALSRLLSGVLFGVSPADPAGLWGAAVFVLAVALTAGVMAARPATRIDPALTLRSE